TKEEQTTMIETDKWKTSKPCTHCLTRRGLPPLIIYCIRSPKANVTVHIFHLLHFFPLSVWFDPADPPNHVEPSALLDSSSGGAAATTDKARNAGAAQIFALFLQIMIFDDVTRSV